METFNIEYPKKENIPITSKEEYKRHLISKVKPKIRWKAIQFLGKLERSEVKFWFPIKKIPTISRKISDF